MQLLTINEAAIFASKSIQTIRRMIKQKKIQVKRHKTPQGFNYLVIKESLSDFLTQSIQTYTQTPPNMQEPTREHRTIETPSDNAFSAEVAKFNMTMQKLIEQHERDKTNFFQLIKTFQDRVFELENQIKLLDSPKGSWWQFWK